RPDLYAGCVSVRPARVYLYHLQAGRRQPEKHADHHLPRLQQKGGWKCRARKSLTLSSHPPAGLPRWCTPSRATSIAALSKCTCLPRASPSSLPTARPVSSGGGGRAEPAAITAPSPRATIPPPTA